MAGSMEARQVGHGFNPREEQLVGHFLRKKLKGQMEANCEIPELFIYDWEPPDLFILYDVLSSEPSAGRECFFFCPRGRKRKTKWGFWKETGIERVVRADTGKPMGTKRYFVYYEGRQPKGRWTDVTMREYHLKLDVSDSEISDPTALVLCRIMKGKSKKAKSATASASTDLSGLSNLNSAQATPGVTIESDYPTEMLNTSLPDWNLPIPDQQPQTYKEQCLCYDDNWHVDEPNDGRCYIPYSLSNGINVTDLSNSDESTGQTQTCKEQHLAYDDNQHVDGPSDKHCDMPNSPSGGIDLEDLLNSD
ncbi:NAC domain-containing protein 89-like isoform X1 [Syzygium oleosum]|uniref:NAC domain-containing protein 89-like isoform X1 n=1 Tax=Syzygium oleosum TaxID=219896 RepID=UPI0024BA3C82|nr:NAC domain-containing protein 89-like isoform X1 [Syzygium oleosum]XP_056161061.1 NAC domain-containing protein 89-like isoform X1 [Syzygium oleosum]